MARARETSEASSLNAVLWSAAAGATCAAMAPLEPNLLEEGILLHAAQRIAEGERLYTDILVFTGPLPFELLAALFKLVGSELVVARAVVVALHALATACACGLAARTGARAATLVVGSIMVAAPVLLFPLLSTYYYSTVQLSIVWMAAYAAERGLAHSSWAVLAGTLVAAAALCKQQVGPPLAVGLAIALASCASPGRRVKAPLQLAAGGVAITILVLVGYVASGPGRLDDVIQALVALPLSFEATFDAPFVNLWPLGSFDERIPPSQRAFYLPYFYGLLYGQWGGVPGRLAVGFTQLLYALPFAAMAVTLAARVRGPLESATWINGAVLIALATTLFPRTDWGHLVFVLPSTAVQFALVGARNLDRARRSSVTGLAAVLLAPALVVVAWLHNVSGEASFGPRIPLRPVSGGYRADAVPHALRYLREHTSPGDPVFVPRAEPLVYFATETRNPTPFPGVIPGMRVEQQRMIIEALADTRYVVMTDIDQPVYTYYRDELPAVQAYLERHFRIPDDFLSRGAKWMLVLEPGPDRGETVLDLIASRDAGDGAAWLREEAGVSPAPDFDDKLATVQNRRYLPIVLGSHGGGIDFEIDVPSGAEFQASVGFPAATGLEQVYQHPSRGLLTVSVSRGRDGNFEPLSTTPIQLKRPLEYRWTPVSVDLDDYAKQRVTLRLSLDIDEAKIGARRLAWWGSPRIARRAAPSASPRSSDRAAK